MNKKSILCTVLALSLVLIGTAYAYWTDTLNITTKATTGDLEVKFVDLGAYAQYDNEDQKNNWSIIDGIGKDGYVKSDFFGYNSNYNDVFGGQDTEYYKRAAGYNSVRFDAAIDGKELTEDYPALPYGKGTIAGDTINIELNNLYPGYAQAFRTDIINIGSIAVKLGKVDFLLKDDSNDVTKDLIGVALLVQDENPITYGDILKLASNFSSEDKFTLGGVDFVRLSALERLTEEEKVAIGENLILSPKAKDDISEGIEHRADLYIGVAVDPDEEGDYTTGSSNNIKSSNNDADTQNKGIELDIKFVWDQFNVGNNPSTTNVLENQN